MATSTRTAAARKGAKTPTDRTPKQTTKPLPTITVDGVTYTANAHPEDVVKRFGVMRQVRRSEDWEALFILIEAMFDDDAIAALDPLPFDQIDEIVSPLFEGLTSGN